MKSLSFDEIDEDKFEDLTAAYFRTLKDDSDSKIVEVEVFKSGKGADGGVDIAVVYHFTDNIKIFKRKWLIQCKFHDENISTNKINSVNIPTLIHSKSANGYLLICKKGPTSKLTNFFEDLNENCKMRYKYHCWDGNEFLGKINLKPNLIEQYFPNHFEYQKNLVK